MDCDNRYKTLYLIDGDGNGSIEDSDISSTERKIRW